MHEDDRLVTPQEAGQITGVHSRSRRYALIAQGQFPRPVKVGTSTLFSAAECHQWVRDRIAERNSQAAESQRLNRSQAARRLRAPAGALKRMVGEAK